MQLLCKQYFISSTTSILIIVCVKAKERSDNWELCICLLFLFPFFYCRWMKLCRLPLFRAVSLIIININYSIKMGIVWQFIIISVLNLNVRSIHWFSQTALSRSLLSCWWLEIFHRRKWDFGHFSANGDDDNNSKTKKPDTSQNKDATTKQQQKCGQQPWPTFQFTNLVYINLP